MHQIQFWLGLRPKPRPCTGGAHSTPQIPKVDLKGPASKGREGEGGQGSGGEGRVFSLYLSIRGLQKSSHGGPGNVLDFL